MTDKPPPIHYEPGTAVRVLTKEEYAAFHNDSLNHLVRQHGYLYVIVRWALGKDTTTDERRDPDNPYIRSGWLCKSVVTGRLEVLFPQEITTERQADDQDRD